jgi:predicted nucleic acid-binding protein
MADLMITAIARTRAAAVVARDTDGFEGSGLTVLNPRASRTSL